MPDPTPASTLETSPPPGEKSSLLLSLLPIIGVVFVAYLVIGLAMPVLPLYVHEGLGRSTFIVGVVAGSQFAVALLSRPWAGYYADSRGSKRSVVMGLLVAIVSGLFYLFSLLFFDRPVLSVTILLLGRMLLGVAENLLITGALSWGLRLCGGQNTGKVMSWIGTSLYAAFALGAPAGTALYAGKGFAGIALAALLLPLITLPLVAPLRAVAPSLAARPSFGKVFRAVWLPGVGLAISGVGFGAVTTFLVLLFAQHGWGRGWLAITLLSVAFIAGRIFFGHLPDQGGVKVAMVCILIEAVGLALIWLAPQPALAFVGVTLTGLGYSLVYPSFGVEALRRAPAESRGLAMGAFTAFLDLSLGLTGPALGLVASGMGLDAVFLASTLVVLGALAIAARLLSAPA
ncbi:MAG: arabinose transporter [Blastocatellia bacterium]